MSDLNALIEDYKRVRDEKDEFAKFYAEKLQTLADRIEATLLEQGLNSARTEAGLVTTYQRRSVRVADWAVFERFAEDYHPEIVKRSIDSTEALKLIDDDVIIPGIEVNNTNVLSVK